MNRTKGYIYGILAAVTWGVVYTVDQKVLGKLSPAGLMLVNSVLSLILLAPWVVWKGKEVGQLLNVDQGTLMFVVFSLVLNFAGNYFIFSAIKNTDAATASIFEIAYPLFVMLFSFFAFKTLPNAVFLLGAGLIFTGAYLVLKFG